MIGNQHNHVAFLVKILKNSTPEDKLVFVVFFIDKLYFLEQF